MEQTVQKLLQDVHTQLSGLEKRKNEFRVDMWNNTVQHTFLKQRSGIMYILISCFQK
jgi:hypothetical protein